MSNVKIHSSAEVHSHSIGPGTTVWQHSIILENAKIGKNCNINAHCFVENEVSIGDDVTIKCGVYVWDGVTIGNKVFIGPNATFTNDLFPRSKNTEYHLLHTYVEDGASIGAASVIIAGVRIGCYAMIGAGSVVTKDVPPYTMWYGNPARFKGYICSCGSRLIDSTVCSECGIKYKVLSNGLEKLP